MTRSASPNGQVEFSYDFPVASTSQLPPKVTTKHTRPRARSPPRPRWESRPQYNDDDDELFDEEIDYDSFGYPRRAHTHPAPTPSPTGRNQWQRPASPPLYPYGSDSTGYATTASAYPYSAPILLAPPAPQYPVGSSCESGSSIMSACSRASKEKHGPAKIRKARRSVDSERPYITAPAPYTSSPASSPASSPYFTSSNDDDFEEEESHHSHDSVFDFEEEEQQEEREEQQEHAGHAPSSLRRQWEALSLRVRFGVFRAKRRMRARVMSL
jgi:hypothetical protein